MVKKYLGFNKLPIGLILLVCVLFFYKYIEIRTQEYFPIIVDNSEDYIDVHTFKSKTRSIAEVKEIIKRRNKDPVMANQRNSINRAYLAVIVVLVRSNTFYFESLIESLKAVVGIKRALVIFSHATYDDHLNDIVKNITSVKYIQIFYPYSVQLHPRDFPGNDPKFCVHDLNCENNKGRRNATVVQRKHHWWWTVNFIFENLKPIEKHNGTIMFLEEEQYVAKDFIYILNILEYTLPNFCPHCKIFSLATLKHNYTSGNKKPSLITVREVGTTQELMGLGFNRTVWAEIKNLSVYFCNFNDADWTRSLVYALMKTTGTPYSMLSVIEPRVFRFEICPSHNCRDSGKVESKQAFVSKIKSRLFPMNDIVQPFKTLVKLNISNGNGGWEDVRDNVLCKFFTVPHIDNI